MGSKDADENTDKIWIPGLKRAKLSLVVFSFLGYLIIFDRKSKPGIMRERSLTADLLIAQHSRIAWPCEDAKETTCTHIRKDRLQMSLPA